MSVICAAALCTGTATAAFRPDVRPGYGLTSLGWLSQETADGADFDGNAPFYRLGLGEKALLLVSGLQPGDLSGTLALTLLAENVAASGLRVLLVPYANVKAYDTDSIKGVTVRGRSGLRLVPWGTGKRPLEPPVMAALQMLIKRENVTAALVLRESPTPDYHVDRVKGTVVAGAASWTVKTSSDDIDLAETVCEAVNKAVPDIRVVRVDGGDELKLGVPTVCLTTPNPGLDSWREKPNVVVDPNWPLWTRMAGAIEAVKSFVHLFGGSLDNVPSSLQLRDSKLGDWLN